MTLARFLASQDDAALTAATSKGLVKRAAKDMQSGAVSVTSQDETQAVCSALGETVEIVGKSIGEAQCTCSAVGTCRHILSAIMVLREGLTPADNTPEAFTFTIPDVERFAGADWAQACALAEQGSVPDSQGSIVVTFAELDSSVTFPPGCSLKDALYKGPVASHKRRMVAAAALAILRSQGTPLPEFISQEVAQDVSPELLDAAAEALESAAVALAAGTLAQARDMVFNVAIETRAEKAPRLAAELRGLSKLMTEEALRNASSTPTDILCRIAKTRALVDALRIAPSDPALVGQLRKSYVPSGHRCLTFLGGESWSTPSGARGLSLHFSDFEGVFYRATEARSAGTDLLFRPEDRWRAPLWGLAAPPKMAGQRVVLADAALAFDNGLSLTQTASFDGAASLGDLPNVMTDWTAIDPAIAAQIGLGLRRRAGEAHILIAPDTVSSVGFDELAQEHVWTWFDAAGEALTLSLKDRVGVAKGLDQLPMPKAGLVAVDPVTQRMRLISLWLEDAAPISLGFDRLPAPKRGFAARLSQIAQRFHPRQQSQFPTTNAHLLFFERALEALLQCILSKTAFPTRLLDEARALGQSHATAALDTWDAEKSVTSALATAYVLSVGKDCSEVRTGSNALGHGS